VAGVGLMVLTAVAVIPWHNIQRMVSNFRGYFPKNGEYFSAFENSAAICR
jgi:hypothetical protein